MRYLFLNSEVLCTWCKNPMLQICQENQEQVVVRLCRLCDRWPEELMKEKEK